MSAKVSGETIDETIGVMMSVFRRRIRDALTEQGIDTSDGARWYTLDGWVSVLQLVEADAGASTLRKLGAATAETLDWNGETTVEDGLSSLGAQVGRRHQSLPGAYEIHDCDDSSARVIVDTPYPCEFDQGVIKATVEQFGAGFARIDETGGCRDDHGRACTYDVRW